MANPHIVTRFAPSPTGFMHVGGARTALFAWLYARKYSGRFILRIEDTDKEREVPGSIEHIQETLAWLGIEWDEGPGKDGPHGPYIQSERLALYKAYAQRLVEAGHAYPDPYSQEELEALRVKAGDERRPFLFRDYRSAQSTQWDGSSALRFRAPSIKRYTWQDAVRGELSAGEEAVDDFILLKADGYPTYNFAHIVDDTEMGVTHVMRAEEFIASTPKFLSLYEALEIQPPVYATLPVILGPSGKKKLSKRDGAKDILDYRTEGYLPEGIVNYLALLGWNPGTEQEFFSLQELIDQFTLERVQASGARFDDIKLLNINQHWLRQLPAERFIARGELKGGDEVILRKAVPLLKERAQTFTEARSLLSSELLCLFERPKQLDPETLIAKEPIDRPGSTTSALQAVTAALSGLREDPSADDVKTLLMPLADTEEAKGKGGRGALLWPLRYALSGQERSPDPFTLISILGTAESMRRVQKALALVT